MSEPQDKQGQPQGEQTPWQPARGPKTRAIIWVILTLVFLGILAMLMMVLGGI